MLERSNACLAAISVASVLCVSAASAATANDPLKFDPTSYTTVHVQLDGAPLEVRHYHVVYVAKPVAVDLSKNSPMGGPPGMGPGGPPGGAPGGPPGMGAGGAPGGPPGGPGGGPGGNPMFAPVTDPLAYESMEIYVPQSAYNNQSTAIILQVGNAGWHASGAMDRVKEGGKFSSTSDTDATGAALKAGYVIVNAGTRSRGLASPSGEWVGKSPAVVVDAKAAIRYLRYNDAVMPGSAERIIITGTSGGGGLSVAVAASGNSADYYPYLAAIGAAGIDSHGHSTIRDDVFGTVAYCPINDLGHADIAYEWQFHDVRTAANTNGGKYPEAMQAASTAQAAQYPAYLESLHLKREDGSAFGVTHLRESILALVTRGVEAALAHGAQVPALGENFNFSLPRGPFGPGAPITLKNDWLSVENGHVKHIDYDNYLKFVTSITPLKSVTAFDAAANTGNKGDGGESSLFGPANEAYSNFTEYGWNHNDVKGDGSGPDDTGMQWAAWIKGPGVELAQQVKMVSPIPYLTAHHATAAPYWYVRHGNLDRDTSFALQTTLYYALKNDSQVKDVNLLFAWLKPHSGDYDVQEAYTWVASTLQRAGTPEKPAK